MTQRRSFLYVPGHRPDLITKAFASQADAVVVDLEDGTPVASKAEARTIARTIAVGQDRLRARLWLRIDATALDVDLDVALAAEPAGVLLAKAELSTTTRAAQTLAGSQIAIVPLIESARALADAQAIARVPGVMTLAVGLVDLMADLRVSREGNDDIVRMLQLQIVMACAAAGRVAPIAPTSTAFRELEEFRTTTRALSALGFRSRTAIHPAQLAVINEEFTPSTEEIDHARRLVELLGDAAVGVDESGRMIDAAVLRAAKEVLARTELTAP